MVSSVGTYEFCMKPKNKKIKIEVSLRNFKACSHKQRETVVINLPMPSKINPHKKKIEKKVKIQTGYCSERKTCY